MNPIRIICFIVISILISSCSNRAKEANIPTLKTENSVLYATGLQLFSYDKFTLIEVKNPWPNAKEPFRYVAVKNGIKLPDSLSNWQRIDVPLKSIVVSSTTHLPSLENLNVADRLKGFPHCDYISSPTLRQRINAGQIQDLGPFQALNMERLLDIQPDVFMGHGIDNNNPQLDQIAKSGIPVILNGDWNEVTPLGKAEWIKLFGVLFGKEKEAETFFAKIVKEYENTVSKLKSLTRKPTAFTGSLYQDRWILPKSDSWGAKLIQDAGGTYLWKDETGLGSLSLSLESVLERAENAEFWIGPGDYPSLDALKKANSAYAQFDAFKNKKIYSFSAKKGEKGGILYYELAPNRPDLVLKDLAKIFHPEHFTEHELVFFKALE